MSGSADRTVVRLRAGIGLVILSWLPIAQVVIWTTGLSGGTAEEFRLSVWVVQVLIGFVGLALAGVAAKAAVKAAGWRRLPRTLWRMFWTGRLA
ncbi:hypothetical protein [Catellatospora tritici]|uniref:hypothetical protein n=1 Tax=Catellatospora tritici TaxID=2851566 RepID=UPI001C2D6C2A|nr:hypothetical protein [Catellatospora tritici]MBV1855104.1 hypothetical protein [Catellatospora tritici]